MPIGVAQSADYEPDHSQWNVVADDSMKLSQHQRANLLTNNCVIFGVEVTSRKLFANRGELNSTSSTTDHKHTIGFEQEIKLLILQPQCKDERKAKWIVVNNTCRFHIHVGNNEKGSPLQTVQNLLSLSTAFERLIDGMHSCSRIGGTGLALAALDVLEYELDNTSNDAVAKYSLDNKVYNVPLTEHFISSAYVNRRTASHPPLTTVTEPHATPTAPTYPSSHTTNNATLAHAVSGFHTTAFLKIIQSAPDLPTLIQFFGNHRRTTINLFNMLSSNRPNTIEFRQYAAVTSAVDVLPWIGFVSALVKYAHESSAKAIVDACKYAATKTRVTLRDFLGALPVSRDTRSHYLDRVNGGVPFFDDVAARKEADVLGVDRPLREVVLNLIKERREAHDQTAFRQAVQKKFAAGGYRQFSREFIDEYAPDLSEEDKEKLTIGLQAPSRSPSPEFDEPEFDLDEMDEVS